MLRVTYILSLIALVTVFSPVLRAQSDSASEMGFSQLQAAVNDMIGRGELVQAEPYLQEIIARFKDAEGVSLEMPLFFLAQAKLAQYQQSGEKRFLQEAETRFTDFLKTYPDSEQTATVLLRMGAVYAELGRLDDAVKTMETLLQPRYERQLTIPQRTTILYDITRLLYLQSKFKEGEPYFKRLIAVTNDPVQKALAAAALFETYMESARFNEALELIPTLAIETEVRYRPRLNVAFFKASDIFANSLRYTDAALVLGLAMTTAEMRAYFEQTRARLQSQLEWLQGLGSTAARVDELKAEIARLDQNLEQMKSLPSLESELLVRKARNYVQTGRAYEAFWLFSRLMEENPKDPQIEFYTYATFTNANELAKTEKAISIAEGYLKDFPNGRYVEDIELTLIYLYKQRGESEKFEKLAYTFLLNFSGNPNAEALLMEYARGLLEHKEYARIETEMKRLATRNPRALYIDGTLYWRGMAYMMERKYKEALGVFQSINKDYPRSSYSAESLFRTGIVLFVLERFNESREALLEFQTRFPADANIDQSYYFLAQIAKLAGEVPQAIEYYKKGIELSRSQDMQNLFHFELADLYLNAGMNAEVVPLLESYLQNYGESGDIATAYLVLGKAEEALRNPGRMLEVYRKAIAETITLPENPGMEEILMSYGKKLNENKAMFGRTLEFFNKLVDDPAFLRLIVTDRGELFEYFYENPLVDQSLYQRFRTQPELGVALLRDIEPLKQLRATYQTQVDAMAAEDAEAFLMGEFAKAAARGDYVGEIRLSMGLSKIGKDQPLSRAVTLEDLHALSPLTLLYVGERLNREGNVELARLAWQEVLNRFPVSDSAIEANKALALDAEKLGKLDEALVYFKTISDQFGSSPEAPEAVLSEGRVLTALKRYAEARKRYEYILLVPDWRGELYARALYGVGKAYQEEGKYAEAHGFMERVFIGYPQFGQWVGRAYLEDARILLAMGQPQDARSTLQEALRIGANSIPPELLTQIRQQLAAIP